MSKHPARVVATCPVVPASGGPSVVPVWALAPQDLAPGAVDVWDRVVAELLARGLTPAMLEGVRALATAGWRMRQAAADIDEHGPVIPGLHGPVVNPAVRVEKDATATWTRLAVEFGLTPAAQMRLGLMRLAGESLLAGLNRDLDA